MILPTIRKPTKGITLSLLVVAVLGFSACAQATAPPPTAALPAAAEIQAATAVLPAAAAATESAVTQAGQTISAKGRLVPLSFANLAPKIDGQVTEVLVKEGEQIEPGALVLRIGDRAQLDADKADAEVEVLAAQQAIDDLQKNAGVELAKAEKALAEAQKVLAFAEDKVTTLKTPTPQRSIDQAYSNMRLAEDKLKKANKDLQHYEQLFHNRSSFIWYFFTDKQFKMLLNNLSYAQANAQGRYDDAVDKYNDLLEPVDEIKLAQAESDLAVAQAKVDRALEDVQKLKTGPDPDKLAAAQSSLAVAEQNLAAAKAELANHELVAPIGGKVMAVDTKAGEWIKAGQPAVVIADTSGWAVETDDLTENQVPQVRVGQAVNIIPDALPELQLPGQVESIQGLSEEKRGDVTYTTRVKLDGSDPRLRWGMNVAVDFGQ